MIHGAPHLNDILSSSLKDLVRAKVKVLQAWSRRGALAPIDPYHLIFSIWSITQHYADFAIQVKAIVGRDLNDDVFLEQTISNVQKILMEGVLPRIDSADAAFTHENLPQSATNSISEME